MEIPIFKQQYGVLTLCKTSQIYYFSLSFDCKHEQRRILCTLLLGGEFKLENILAWSQTLYIFFSVKVRRARVIKNKNSGNLNDGAR